MAVYTTQLKSWCESLAGMQENSSVNEVINNSVSKIFNFTYPIYDESYRNVLNTKILKHYYFREIGLETVGLFRSFLDRKLNEIMPYYNQLYKSTLLEFNPFYDVELTREHNTSRKDDENIKRIDNTTQKTDETKTDTYTSISSDIGKTTNTDNNNSTSDTTGTETANGTTKNTRTDTSSETLSGKTTTSGSDNRTDTGSNSSSGTTSTDTTDKYSDTPQSVLDNIENNKYLTNVRLISGLSSQNQSGETKNSSTGSMDSTQTISNTTDIDGTITDSGTNKNDKNNESHTSTMFQGNKVEDSSNTINVKNDDKIISNSNMNSDLVSNNDRILNSLEDYIEHVKGKQGTQSYASLLQEFRNTFLNIDMLIIEELEPLFMQLWN